MAKQRIFSGIQPTGDLHIGNYFGALANWVKLQDEYDCVYGVVDLHAMTMPYDPQVLKTNTENMVVDLLAAGLDPAKSIICLQSLVPEHTELYWMFSCLTPYGDLTRQTQFKDKSDQLDTSSGKEFVSAGLFTYPALQAADILVYLAGHVPVGKDQEQHLELSREIARRFNMQFGELFPEPQVLSTSTPKILSPADPTKKMSKSLGSKHYIGLFEEEASIRKKIRSAVTDSGDTPEGEISPGVASLFELLYACGKDDDAASLKADYEAGTLRYVNLKDAVATGLVELTDSLREQRAAIDKADAMKQVAEMSEKARDIAANTVSQARKLMGLPARATHR
jgi:tryptophanyl-tRNA synthetase